MIGSMTQIYLFSIKPKILGWLSRLLYLRSNVKFGKNFTCDSVPRIFVDSNAKLFIGDEVQFRKDVELRAHGHSSIKINSEVRVDRGVRILSANEALINIGDRTAIGLYSVLNGGDDISLGKACLISGFVYLQTSMHKYEKGDYIKDQGYTHSPIKLGDDVWLGAHVVILPGCDLDDGVIIGSNAVVKSSIESNQIAAGVPAKIIGTRN
jgi:acetyltransferase-like isoleucine patch superfamily enzyme